MTYYAIDTDKIDQQNKDGYPPLDLIRVDDGALLITSTEDLRQYVSDYGDRIFSKAGQYKRKINEDAAGDNTVCQLPGKSPT